MAHFACYGCTGQSLVLVPLRGLVWGGHGLWLSGVSSQTRCLSPVCLLGLQLDWSTGHPLCAASYEVWPLELWVHWYVWLSSPLPRAEVILEWYQSLLELFTECIRAGGTPAEFLVHFHFIWHELFSLRDFFQSVLSLLFRLDHFYFKFTDSCLFHIHSVIENIHWLFCFGYYVFSCKMSIWFSLYFLDFIF